MIKLAVDAVKVGHPIYSYLKYGTSDKFTWVDSDADVTIVALENPESHNRVTSYTDRGKKVFMYFEHISSLREVHPSITDSPYCLGSIAHATSSVEEAKRWMPGGKHYHMPIGVPTRNLQRVHERINSDYIPTFMFWSSWNNMDGNQFYGRGGLAVDEIFHRVRQKVNCKLICRLPNRNPVGLVSQGHFPESVYATTDYISDQQLEDLHWQSDILMLVSCQAHFATIPYAMAFGMPCIGNHNWGFDDNVKDGYNGLLDNYGTPGERCMDRGSVDFNYVEKMSARLIELLQDKERFKQMRLNALHTQITEHNVADYPEKIAAILGAANV